VFFADHIIDDLICNQCGKKSQFTETKRFKTFPRHLVVVLQRFVLDSWVPKKLEIDLKFEADNVFNFEKFKGLGL